jgi:cyclohexanone monooxygenase
MNLLRRCDAIVVGAGFSGIQATYRLRQLGLSIITIEKGSDVGGTWYWNRYPGALSDTESHLYRFSGAGGDPSTTSSPNRYLRQDEIQAYLKNFVNHHDLDQFFQFDTEMTGARWDNDELVWKVTTNRGLLVARYLVTGLGLLSAQKLPSISGTELFKGTIKHTSSWDPNLDLRGKRVGVIGNGSTGTQVMTAIAPVVKKLVSFQRTPQYSVPAGNRPLTFAEREAISDNYSRVWDEAFRSATAFGFMESTRPAMSVSAEERERIFESLWNQGNGFRFMFSAFGDLTLDPIANEECCDFIRRKINAMVKDPDKARLLQPDGLFAKRPVCDSGYFEIFNQDNVHLVDLKASPIVQMNEAGIVTADGRLHELDVIIYATGFDAVDGSYTRLDIRGSSGESITKHWDGKASSYLGVATADFPNFFMSFGPQSPFSNNPPMIESEVTFICAAIEHNETRRQSDPKSIMHVKRKAEQEWGELCDELAKDSLYTKHGSWINGDNIAGKKVGTRFFFGGLGYWRTLADQEIDAGFPSFR